mmetsp:Transcript_2753/g.10796  ORF Transcript_2753/g.10796 Transcript_2753/m.10796 type:complete len:432 (-) Transcript_2753:6890-8185(-)
MRLDGGVFVLPRLTGRTRRIKRSIRRTSANIPRGGRPLVKLLRDDDAERPGEIQRVWIVDRHPRLAQDNRLRLQRRSLTRDDRLASRRPLRRARHSRRGARELMRAQRLPHGVGTHLDEPSGSLLVDVRELRVALDSHDCPPVLDFALDASKDVFSLDRVYLVHHLRRLLVGVQGRPHGDVGADDAAVLVPLARELCARFRLQDFVSGCDGGFFRVLRIVSRRGSRQRRAHPRGIERATLGRRFDHPGRQSHAAVEVFHGVERAHLVRGAVVLVVAPFLLLLLPGSIFAGFCERFPERFPVRRVPVFLLRLHVVLARPAAGLPVVGLPVPTRGGHPAAPVVLVLVADDFGDFFSRGRRLPGDQQRAELTERRRRGDADGRGQVEEQPQRSSRGDDDGPAIRPARRVARGSRLELQRQFEEVGVVSRIAVNR